MSKRKDALDEVLNGLTANHNALLQEVEEKIKEQRDGLDNMIKKNPFISITVAFGAGYLLAKFFNIIGRR